MVKFNEHFGNWSLQSSVSYKIQTRNILERYPNFGDTTGGGGDQNSTFQSVYMYRKGGNLNAIKLRECRVF